MGRANTAVMSRVIFILINEVCSNPCHPVSRSATYIIRCFSGEVARACPIQTTEGAHHASDSSHAHERVLVLRTDALKGQRVCAKQCVYAFGQPATSL